MIQSKPPFSTRNKCGHNKGETGQHKNKPSPANTKPSNFICSI